MPKPEVRSLCRLEIEHYPRWRVIAGVWLVANPSVDTTIDQRFDNDGDSRK
jgi:hypothetical protein